ncbi:hypothetical protein GCM10023168_15280 [Fodinibacter luteus]|uniref:Dolichyl-phosphate-mannose-protein mannosyltransferase n=1 Tax=Fodinibacter luteus TaxID=552064 RepID=A0ABP8KBY1_9MICO
MGRVVVALMGVLLVAVGSVAVVAPVPVFTTYRQPVVVLVAVLFVVVALAWRPPALLRRAVASRWTAPAVAVAGGWVAVVVATSLRFPWSWDLGAVHQIARVLYAGEPLSPWRVGYLSRYPNIHLLVDLHRSTLWVEERTGWAADTVLVVLVALAAGAGTWLVHPLVAPVAGRVRAVAAQLVVLALVATSPWVAVPYTDVLALPLVTAAVLLVLRASRRRDPLAVVQLLASAALAALAIALKTTPLVLLVAVAVVGLLAAVDARASRREVLAVVGGTLTWLVVTLGLVLALTGAATRAVGDVGLREGASPPPLWWVANGMTPVASPGHPTRYGGYNGVMLAAVADLDREAATRWSAEWIEARYAGEGVGGLARFYATKAAWNWGDGMFWAWGEGRDARPETLRPADGLAGWVRDVDGPHGRWYPVRSDLAQGLWIAVVVLAGMGALGTRSPPREVVLLPLTLLGVAAFTLLSQGRSRYLLTFVPLVVALAAMVAPRVTGRRRP